MRTGEGLRQPVGPSCDLPVEQPLQRAAGRKRQWWQCRRRRPVGLVGTDRGLTERPEPRTSRSVPVECSERVEWPSDSAECRTAPPRTPPARCWPATKSKGVGSAEQLPLPVGVSAVPSRCVATAAGNESSGQDPRLRKRRRIVARTPSSHNVGCTAVRSGAAGRTAAERATAPPQLPTCSTSPAAGAAVWSRTVLPGCWLEQAGRRNRSRCSRPSDAARPSRARGFCCSNWEDLAKQEGTSVAVGSLVLQHRSASKFRGNRTFEGRLHIRHDRYSRQNGWFAFFRKRCLISDFH